LKNFNEIIQMETRYYRRVKALAVFTIVYNIIEGLVSVFIGAHDETLTLFGFGVDSFIEMVSGIGILHMVIRIGKNNGSTQSRFEITALRITGWSFYILAIGLVTGSVLNFYQGHKPESTIWGVVVSGISIIVMAFLYRAKVFYGKRLNSEAIIADGRCTLVCIYMSVVLLLSSAVYEITGIGWMDAVGAMGLAWLSYKEGKEAFEKAKGKQCSCDDQLN
jgi:divalent metal cation (Fe/Co/Zn/Cd) transporter